MIERFQKPSRIKQLQGRAQRLQQIIEQRKQLPQKLNLEALQEGESLEQDAYLAQGKYILQERLPRSLERLESSLSGVTTELIKITSRGIKKLEKYGPYLSPSTLAQRKAEADRLLGKPLIETGRPEEQSATSTPAEIYQQEIAPSQHEKEVPPSITPPHGESIMSFKPFSIVLPNEQIFTGKGNVSSAILETLIRSFSENITVNSAQFALTLYGNDTYGDRTKLSQAIVHLNKKLNALGWRIKNVAPQRDRLQGKLAEYTLEKLEPEMPTTPIQEVSITAPVTSEDSLSSSPIGIEDAMQTQPVTEIQRESLDITLPDEQTILNNSELRSKLLEALTAAYFEEGKTINTKDLAMMLYGIYNYDTRKKVRTMIVNLNHLLKSHGWNIQNAVPLRERNMANKLGQYRLNKLEAKKIDLALDTTTVEPNTGKLAVESEAPVNILEETQEEIISGAPRLTMEQAAVLSGVLVAHDGTKILTQNGALIFKLEDEVMNALNQAAAELKFQNPLPKSRRKYLSILRRNSLSVVEQVLISEDVDNLIDQQDPHIQTIFITLLFYYHQLGKDLFAFLRSEQQQQQQQRNGDLEWRSYTKTNGEKRPKGIFGKDDEIKDHLAVIFKEIQDGGIITSLPVPNISSVIRKLPPGFIKYLEENPKYKLDRQPRSENDKRHSRYGISEIAFFMYLHDFEEKLGGFNTRELEEIRFLIRNMIQQKKEEDLKKTNGMDIETY